MASSSLTLHDIDVRAGVDSASLLHLGGPSRSVCKQSSSSLLFDEAQFLAAHFVDSGCFGTASSSASSVDYQTPDSDSLAQGYSPASENQTRTLSPLLLSDFGGIEDGPHPSTSAAYVSEDSLGHHRLSLADMMPYQGSSKPDIAHVESQAQAPLFAELLRNMVKLSEASSSMSSGLFCAPTLLEERSDLLSSATIPGRALLEPYPSPRLSPELPMAKMGTVKTELLVSPITSQRHSPRVSDRTKNNRQRQHPCPVCGHTFARAYNLKQHMPTHEASSVRRLPFHCSQYNCHKGFSRKHDLHRHLSAVHRMSPCT